MTPLSAHTRTTTRVGGKAADKTGHKTGLEASWGKGKHQGSDTSRLARATPRSAGRRRLGMRPTRFVQQPAPNPPLPP
eukprot:CAMPEP_0173418778 /NCGR_PEP_ID=MMETSP1357-20121228/836_1 /TAXON_ID=77926 /ORGANISM="Hemiselmis rufescens, Strain PCC563" /LENGTH=77 /DNA_ID=CAMNT_0014381319 /DNA_START=69 /DNA_END=299 /DNA_ORIENTATION=+